MNQIKNYEELNLNIKIWLDEIVSEDKYGLRADTLYRNILSSSGDDRQLAQIFEVPVGLIKAIKDSEK